jgi:uncharacterized protein YndB with AHSA1/START domain
MKRTTFEPGPISEVAYRAAGDRWELVFVRELRHPRELVWAALTEPARLSEWAPFLADRNLGTPGEATLTMIDGDVSEPMSVSVVRAEPPALLEYTWGSDLLRWELTGTEQGTRLTLTHAVTDPTLVPNLAAGWHLCLDVAEHLLDGQPIGPIRGSDARDYGWDDLREAYAERLGISTE